MNLSHIMDRPLKIENQVLILSSIPKSEFISISTNVLHECIIVSDTSADIRE